MDFVHENELELTAARCGWYSLGCEVSERSRSTIEPLKRRESGTEDMDRRRPCMESTETGE